MTYVCLGHDCIKYVFRDLNGQHIHGVFEIQYWDDVAGILIWSKQMITQDELDQRIRLTKLEIQTGMCQLNNIPINQESSIEMLRYLTNKDNFIIIERA